MPSSTVLLQGLHVLHAQLDTPIDKGCNGMQAHKIVEGTEV